MSPLTLRRRAVLTGPSYDDMVIADGAVHYWPLQGAVLSTVGADLIGSVPLGVGGDGTAMVFADPGPRGKQAVRFQGGQSLWTGDANALPAVSLASISMELWFRSDSASGDRSLGLFRRQVSNSEAIMMLHNSPSDGQARGLRNGAFATAGAGAFNDGQWHHRVDVVDNGTYYVYVDGALLQSGSTTNPANGDRRRLLVGGSPTGTQQFSGWISHVALYTVALSAAQVAAHYAAL